MEHIFRKYAPGRPGTPTPSSSFVFSAPAPAPNTPNPPNPPNHPPSNFSHGTDNHNPTVRMPYDTELFAIMSGFFKVEWPEIKGHDVLIDPKPPCIKVFVHFECDHLSKIMTMKRCSTPYYCDDRRCQTQELKRYIPGKCGMCESPL